MKPSHRILEVIGLLAFGAMLAFVFCGCMSSKSLSNVIRELAKDPAVANVSVVSPGITVSISRIGVTTNSVTISPSGAVAVNAKP